MKLTGFTCLLTLSLSFINAHAAPAHDITSFISDFHRYKLGELAPDIYFTREYTIKEWWIRHLPKPESKEHWTYMGENYVLLDDQSHKILKVLPSDIFFKHTD